MLAVGTVGTLVVALRQLATERRARHTGEARRAALEHRRYADAVSAWYGGNAGKVSMLELANRSDQPVYEVVVSLAFVQGGAPRTTEDWAKAGDHQFPYTRCLVVLPPGRFRVEVPAGWGGMMARPGAEIAFTDVQGNSWIRRTNGVVEELGQNAIDAFGISRPVDYVPPDRSPEAA